MITPPELADIPFMEAINSEFYDTNGLVQISNAFAAADAGLTLPTIRTHIKHAVKKFGFQWETKETNGNVQAYPEVKLGRKPWDAFSSVDLLPIRLGDVKQLTVSLDYKTAASGGCNAAFDLWLMKTKDGGPPEIAAEIMVWLGMQGEARPAGDVTVPVVPYRDLGNQNIALYEGSVGWPIYTFLPNVRVEQGEIDLLQLLHYLTGQRGVSKDLWLSAVEFGNEIWSGAGWTLVNKYEVTLR